MAYGIYLRLDITVHDNWRAVIHAAAKKLAPRARRDRAQREARHRSYRQMLEHHREAHAIVSNRRL
ncbi:MAG: hypothetical protein K2X43_05980 [Hyphomonadaceae bacterium]|nr:hypothetical protein [Hyphomonadaceae bacterium]